MDIKEAYQVMQKAWVEENDVRVGDTVRILRENGNHELGSNSFPHSKAEFHNKIENRTFSITNINKTYVQCDGYSVSWFILGIVDQPRDTSKMIKIKGKKWSEDTIAEALKAHAND